MTFNDAEDSSRDDAENELPPADIDADLMLPTVLRRGYQVGGRYTLGRPLGKGGYGSLWEARDEQTTEQVAVKVLQSLPLEPGFREAAVRLNREGRAYRKLSHPAVAKLRNIGRTDQGEPYIVMELLRGQDLAGALRHGGTRTPEEAVRLLLPIADALAEAHDVGLVHRDVKLGNIFLAEQPDGTLMTKLIDFGLTKEMDELAAQTLTAAGVRIGSPSYMSPEQARGNDVDIRSDLWSFCVVLFRIVTGKLPFTGETMIKKRLAIIEKEPPTFADLGVDEPELWTIVARGLRKPPEERYASMRELASALREWLARE